MPGPSHLRHTAAQISPKLINFIKSCRAKARCHLVIPQNTNMNHLEGASMIANLVAPMTPCKCSKYPDAMRTQMNHEPKGSIKLYTVLNYMSKWPPLNMLLSSFVLVLTTPLIREPRLSYALKGSSQSCSLLSSSSISSS